MKGRHHHWRVIRLAHQMPHVIRKHQAMRWCLRLPATKVLRFGIPALCQFVIPFVDFVDPFVIILIKRVYKLIVFIGVVIYRSVKRDIILTKTPKSKIPKPLRYSQWLLSIFQVVYVVRAPRGGGCAPRSLWGHQGDRVYSAGIWIFWRLILNNFHNLVLNWDRYLKKEMCKF